MAFKRSVLLLSDCQTINSQDGVNIGHLLRSTIAQISFGLQCASLETVGKIRSRSLHAGAETMFRIVTDADGIDVVLEEFCSSGV